MKGEALLHVENLVKHFHVRLGAFGESGATVHALDDVTFDIIEGETLSLVGESGCGKSTTGFSLLNLHEPTAGAVIYKGKDIATLDEHAMRRLRGPADRLSGSLFDAQSAHDDWRGHRRADPVPRQAEQGGGP